MVDPPAIAEFGALEGVNVTSLIWLTYILTSSRPAGEEVGTDVGQMQVLAVLPLENLSGNPWKSSAGPVNPK